MAENTIRWNRDADGIVTLTLDDPTGSVNVMNEHYRASMRRAVERLDAEKDSITGVIITSAKKSFFAGGDLKHLITIGPDGAEAIFDTIEAIKSTLRALEKLAKPVVATINGAALGGGLEIALACHYRIAADAHGLVVGLPEVPIGLMPGGGGVTRTVRMFGIRKAFVEILSQGTRFHPAEALEVGLVDEVLPTIEELLPAAKAWIKANPDAHVQPWDAEGFEMPGGIPPSLAASLKKQLGRTLEPARQAILDAAVEGAHVDFDTASRIESRYFTSLVTGQVAKNMIQAFFLDLRSINSGDSRPAGIAKQPITKIGVVGSGMTGAGIAHVSAKAGFDVVLEDDSAHPADFTGADFVMKAIDVTREALGETLAITGLTPGVKRQEGFIGIHFFSPVDKMPLVEIIKGEKTSDEALARVFDYTLAIGKTPIVVNDSRGFFTSRVIGTLVNEALAMLGEGIVAASIEQAGNQAGYPAPPLQLSDELNLELIYKIAVASRKCVEDAGGTYEPHPAEAVAAKMIAIGRPSRLKGAGFYEYEYVDGKRVGLWPGLKDTFGSDAAEIPLQDMIDRMLFAEAIETQKCIDEGVLMTTADANIGSIMGIGFPPYTGGSAQFIVGYQGADGTGKEAFVARAKELAARYGERFTPPASLQT